MTIINLTFRRQFRFCYVHGVVLIRSNKLITLARRSSNQADQSTEMILQISLRGAVIISNQKPTQDNLFPYARPDLGVLDKQERAGGLEGKK